MIEKRDTLKLLESPPKKKDHREEMITFYQIKKNVRQFGMATINRRQHELYAERTVARGPLKTHGWPKRTAGRKREGLGGPEKHRESISWPENFIKWIENLAGKEKSD